MKSSNVWHGHSTRPSLPAGTVRKASGHLSGRGPSILLTQDRSVAQKPHWGFCCCANASLPWQAEQAHHANNEKQEVPSGGELPAVHIAVVCGFWQGASAGRTLFFVLYKWLSSLRKPKRCCPRSGQTLQSRTRHCRQCGCRHAHRR